MRRETLKASRVRHSLCHAALAVAIAACLPALDAAAQSQQPTAQEKTSRYDIPAGDLEASLDRFSTQSGVQVVYRPELVAGKRAPALSGTMTPAAALQRLLQGSGLVSERANAQTYALKPLPAPKQSAAPQTQARPSAQDSEVVTLDTMVVRGYSEILSGGTSQNVDIRRTENDAQPYVVFDSEEIEKSGATTLEDFFRARLPMNTQRGSARQGTNLAAAESPPPASNISEIDLRGLGGRQTLILVDGRRMARALDASRESFNQTDINGIPISAIERIEVLPSSAGGIYGGHAVGGVINIIRKRDYKGLDLRASYDAPVRGGGESWNLGLSGGFGLEQGKTLVSFSASYNDSNPLFVKDNDLWRKGRTLYYENAPTTAVPPVGGTPNICSATNGSPICDLYWAENFPDFGFIDAPLVLDNGTSLGSGQTFVPVGYSGSLDTADGGSALVGNAGQYNLDLGNDLSGRRYALLNNPRVRSLNLNVRRSFSSAIDAFVDIAWSDNLGRALYSQGNQSFLVDADAPNNPFQQDIVVSIPVIGPELEATTQSKLLAVTGGLIARLGRGWMANAEYNWSRSKTSGIFFYDNADDDLLNAAALNGEIDLLRDLNQFPIDYSPYLTEAFQEEGPISSTSKLLSARASGPLFHLWGKPAVFTVLAELQAEKVATFSSVTHNQLSFAPHIEVVFPARSQRVESLYAELKLPILSRDRSARSMQDIEATFAARHDRYRTRVATPSNFTIISEGAPWPDVEQDAAKFASTDITAALLWSPIRDIKFRASYATGFLPPSLHELVPGQVRSGSRGQYSDPRRGNQLITQRYQTLDGGGDYLNPERSKNLSFGLILEPSFLSGFRASVDYSQISKSDEIARPTVLQILALEELIPDRIVRNDPSPADIALGWAGPIALIDTSYLNFAKAKVSSLDVQFDYSIDWQSLGEFRFYAIGTKALKFERQLTPATLTYDTVGYSDGPLDLRGNIGIDWSKGQWRAAWNMQYYDDYSLRFGDLQFEAAGDQNVAFQGGVERIPSQTYHDFSLAYRFRSQSSILEDVEVVVAVMNAFDSKPPVVASPVNGYSFYGDPRLQRVAVTLKKHF